MQSYNFYNQIIYIYKNITLHMKIYLNLQYKCNLRYLKKSIVFISKMKRKYYLLK